MRWKSNWKMVLLQAQGLEEEVAVVPVVPVEDQMTQVVAMMMVAAGGADKIGCALAQPIKLSLFLEYFVKITLHCYFC
jgi:hypothetical protein